MFHSLGNNIPACGHPRCVLTSLVTPHRDACKLLIVSMLCTHLTMVLSGPLIILTLFSKYSCQSKVPSKARNTANRGIFTVHLLNEEIVRLHHVVNCGKSLWSAMEMKFLYEMNYKIMVITH